MRPVHVLCCGGAPELVRLNWRVWTGVWTELVRLLCLRRVYALESAHPQQWSAFQNSACFSEINKNSWFRLLLIRSPRIAYIDQVPSTRFQARNDEPPIVHANVHLLKQHRKVFRGAVEKFNLKSFWQVRRILFTNHVHFRVWIARRNSVNSRIFFRIFNSSFELII